ncbi:RDD family protein [Chryseobacterium sp. 52]|uniref:RDD family protein n=1 Tax=Chryseobacterium sp. 52 TaxID=2035213 RepID=UPI000C17E4A4|nr:RDD family protein [Chryseobacterium sp. 52]PIF46233.1 RDD family protein [Chryseobacterium sp. 52]
MKISELKDRRIIRRPTREFDEFGYRIYNSFEYDFPYNATYKGNERERLFAKLIDMLLFFLIFYFLFGNIAIMSFLYSIPCVIISGSICESYWGTTLGKSIFKIKVIDDFGNYPGLLLSLKRNFLCLANFWPVFIDYIPPINHTWEKEFTHLNFSMNLNNKICKTYIVKESKIAEIQELLKQDKPEDLLFLDRHRTDT